MAFGIITIQKIIHIKRAKQIRIKTGNRLKTYLNNIMKAIILARVLTEEQKEAGNFLPAQIERIKNYCKVRILK